MLMSAERKPSTNFRCSPWNGAWGAPMIRVPNDAMDHVISFVRQNDDDKVFAAFNFSAESVDVGFDEALFHGDYADFASGERVTMTAESRVSLPAWGYRVYVQ